MSKAHSVVTCGGGGGLGRNCLTFVEICLMKVDHSLHTAAQQLHGQETATHLRSPLRIYLVYEAFTSDFSCSCFETALYLHVRTVLF